MSPERGSRLAQAVRLLAVGAVALLAGCGGQAPGPPEIVTVDAGITYQTMEGFGVTERLFNDPHISNDPHDSSSSPTVVPYAARQEILSALFYDLGLTRMRVGFPTGVVEPVNDNGNPRRIAPEGFTFARAGADTQIALVRNAQAFGLDTFFLLGAIEPWFTNDPQEAAEWDFAMLLHWRGAGLEPPFFSPINEPEVSHHSPEWLRQVVLGLGRRMRAAGLETKLVIPDDVNPDAAYRRAAAVLEDPEARQYVGAVAYHLYGGDVHGLRRIGELAARYGLPVWMTEYSYSHPTYGAPEDSLAWAIRIHELVTQGNVSAIDYLWGFFGDWKSEDTLIAIDFDDGVYRSHTPTLLYYLTGQWSRFVRPGDWRIRAQPSGNAVLTSAFRSRDRVVIVAVNPSDDTQKVTYLLTGGRFGVRASGTRTSSSDRWRDLDSIPIRRSRLQAELPAESVTTFVVPLQP